MKQIRFVKLVIRQNGNWNFWRMDVVYEWEIISKVLVLEAHRILR